MAKNYKPSIWDNPKNQELLEKLAAQELYASEIALQLKTTRNSVIGRAKRTGVNLSQPGKMLRLRREAIKTMLAWKENPDNEAYRVKRIREGWAIRKALTSAR